jgi:hypothetical protein
MPDQRAITGALLGKATDAAKLRDQRRHRRPWRRIEISLAALEFRSLTHRQVPGIPFSAVPFAPVLSRALIPRLRKVGLLSA